jgi:hypothetical protein
MPAVSPLFKEQLNQWLKGNQLACQFIEQLTEMAHLWDDLVDRDRPIQPEVIHQAFWDLLIALPRNTFYVQNFALLNSLIQQAILNWHIANTMEGTDDDVDKQIAFILRSSYVDLITACAWILGGEKWAIHVGCEVRRQTSREGYAAYVAHLRAEGVSHGVM